MGGKRIAKTGMLLLVLGAGLAGCARSNAPATPSAVSLSPSPPPPLPSPTPIQFFAFADPVSGFSTSDLRDVDDEFVRFTGNILIWVADGKRFPDFFVNGNLIGADHIHTTVFQVRFGTKDGERRAYLTRPDDRLLGAPATILDLHIDGRGDIRWADTTVVVPGR